MEWTYVRDEDLVVGDTVRVLGVRRVTAIRKYDGPHTGIGCFALADTEPGTGFSLWHGQTTEALR